MNFCSGAYRLKRVVDFAATGAGLHTVSMYTKNQEKKETLHSGRGSIPGHPPKSAFPSALLKFADLGARPLVQMPILD